jgi:hypothetical protein
MMNKISNFFKELRSLDIEGILAIIVTTAFLSFLILVPFFTLYLLLKILTPNTLLPNTDTNNEFKNVTLVRYKETDKHNKDSRLFSADLRRNIDKEESDKYTSKLKELNDNRFDFSDIQKFLFLRDDVNEVNSIETTIHINCDNGIFSIGHRAYKFNEENTSLRTRLNKYEFEAKKYPEIDNMATKLCAKSKKHSVY